MDVMPEKTKKRKPPPHAPVPPPAKSKGRPTGQKMHPPAHKPTPTSTKLQRPKMTDCAPSTMELDGGGRFAKLEEKIEASSKSEESAKAIAATVGRKKYGAEKMAKLASAGKKKAT